MQVSPEQIDCIIRWAGQTPDIAEVYLFGSRVKGTAHEHSDLDVALDFDLSSDIAHAAFFEDGKRWKELLERDTGLSIDLQPLLPDSYTHFVRSAVENHGVLIYRIAQRIRSGFD